MSCRRIEKDLEAYLDGEVTEAVAEAIREHLARCRSCEALLAELQGVGAALETWKAPDPSSDLRARIGARLAEEGAREDHEPVPPEIRAREFEEDRRAATQAEKDGLAEAGRAGAVTVEESRERFRGAARWAAAVAATIVLGLLLWRFFSGNWGSEEGSGGKVTAVDRSGRLAPRLPVEVSDRRHFVLPDRERDELFGEKDPDPYRVLVLAALGRGLSGTDRFEKEKDGIEVLAPEIDGDEPEFGALQGGARSARSPRGPLDWLSPLFGEPAWAGEPGRIGLAESDPDFRAGLGEYAAGRFLEADRRFEDFQYRVPVSSASAASALAQRVRCLAAARDYREAERLIALLENEHPDRRELARVLRRQIKQAEAWIIAVDRLRGELAKPENLQTRWELASAEARAWDLPAAARTLDEGLAGGAAFESDRALASRMALALAHVRRWLGDPPAALDAARVVAERGVSPYAEIGAIEAGLLEASLGNGKEAVERLSASAEALAAREEKVWEDVRVLVLFQVGLLYRIDLEDVARSNEILQELAKDHPDSRLARRIKERFK